MQLNVVHRSQTCIMPGDSAVDESFGCVGVEGLPSARVTRGVSSLQEAAVLRGHSHNVIARPVHSTGRQMFCSSRPSGQPWVLTRLFRFFSVLTQKTCVVRITLPESWQPTPQLRASGSLCDGSVAAASRGLLEAAPADKH